MLYAEISRNPLLFFYIRIIILAKSEARTSMKSRKWDQFIIPSYKPFFFCICIVYKYIRPCGFNLFWWYGKKFRIRNKAIFIHINGCRIYVDNMTGVKIVVNLASQHETHSIVNFSIQQEWRGSGKEGRRGKLLPEPAAVFTFLVLHENLVYDPSNNISIYI